MLLPAHDSSHGGNDADATCLRRGHRGRGRTNQGMLMGRAEIGLSYGLGRGIEVSTMLLGMGLAMPNKELRDQMSWIATSEWVLVGFQVGL